jgi:PadR family transcriptional regulator PadR
MKWIAAKWGESESGRRVKIYSLTRAGRKQLEQQESRWHRSAGIIDRFFKIPKEA